MKTIRSQTVAPAQSKKQMARPLVGQRELNLDWRIPQSELGEMCSDAFERCLRCLPFAGRSGAGAGEQRLDFPQLVAQLRFGRHRVAPSWGLQNKALHPDLPMSTSWNPLSTSFGQCSNVCVLLMRAVPD
jgi:hypothetical protein